MIIIDSHKKMLALWDLIRNEFETHHYLIVDIKSGKTRSNKQNAALHLFCHQLAETLNAAGIDFRHFHKEGYLIPFDDYLVKEHVWRPIQKVVTRHTSTTKPTKAQYIEIYEILSKHLAENHGIACEWPCIPK